MDVICFNINLFRMDILETGIVERGGGGGGAEGFLVGRRVRVVEEVYRGGGRGGMGGGVRGRGRGMGEERRGGGW